MRVVERLTPADLAVLWPEDFGWPQDVGLLAMLDAPGLDVERLRFHVESRAGALPPRFVRALRRASGMCPTPATSLNARLGPSRRYALARTGLAECKAAAHAHDATVNDVLLCVLAGGLRALLMSRGEDADGMLLRAAVPVAQHMEPGRAEGNNDGGVLLALPVGEPDPVTRLRQVARDSAARKCDAVLAGAASPFFRAGLVQRLAAAQRLSNSYVANVPGPPTPLSVAGASIREAFPIVPLLGNLTIGLGAMSYSGQLAITLVADSDACPDLEIVVQAMTRDLDALVRTGPATAAIG